MNRATARGVLAFLLLVIPTLFFASRPGVGIRSASAQEARQTPVEVTITAKNFAFSPSRIEVHQDDIVKVTLKAEDMAHSFTVDEYRISKRAAPGRPAVFEFRADKSGTFSFYCDLTTDDRCRNMRGELVVRK